jgi:hypothetical protein
MIPAVGLMPHVAYVIMNWRHRAGINVVTCWYLNTCFGLAIRFVEPYLDLFFCGQDSVRLH